MRLQKTFTALLAAAALALTACGGGSAAPSAGGTSAPGASETATPTQGGDTGKTLEIGVLQYVTHTALDAVTKGFTDELAARGYKDGEKIKLDVQNPQADQATLTAIANKFAQDKKDLVLGIATPAAQGLAQAIADAPVLFGAVTDPVVAGLVKSWDAPGGNVTGVSDMNPVEDQLKLLLEIAPNVKTVGIVYSSGEVNAEVQVAAAEKAATELGLTIAKAAVSNSSEVQQAAESLKVDAFYVPTDNNVVAGLEGLIQVAEKNKVPVVASDEGSVERGAIAANTVNYEQQGKDVADMAVKIIEGAKPADLPVQAQKNFDLNVNEAAAQRMGVTIPAAVLDRAAKKF